MLIGIPTKNRIESLYRCVSSIKHNSEIYGKVVEFVILDDSDDYGSNRANLDVLKNLNVNFSYYYHRDVDEYVNYLSRRVECPSSILKFAFEKTHSSYGAVRNFLMLMAGSRPIIMVDDDMICKFSDVPYSESVIHNFDSKVVYPDAYIITPVNEHQLVDRDFIKMHKDMLEKVQLSIGGSVGDSGMSHSYVVMPRVMEQLSQDPESLVKMSKRQILRSVSNPTIVNWGCCVGMSFAINPVSTLPPFFPIGRSEDILFGGMLRNCMGEKLGYCPYSMWHTPFRPDTEKGIYSLGTITTSEFLYVLLEEINPNTLEMFGQTLVALSYQDLQWVERKYRDRKIEVFTKLQNHLPELLNKEIERVKKAISTAPRYEVPYSLIRKYGELIIAWPKIWEAAQDYVKYKLQVCVHAPSI